jgi:hypothetical protein
MSVSCFLQTLFLLKKNFLGRSFQEKIRVCHQGISLGHGDYLQSAISYYSGLSILIYLSYAKHLGTGTKAQNKVVLSGGAKDYSWRLKY